MRTKNLTLNQANSYAEICNAEYGLPRRMCGLSPRHPPWKSESKREDPTWIQPHMTLH